ncbi:MAG: methyl-accepting chemotaxis protein [Candidatus Omnitrophota bacterium]
MEEKKGFKLRLSHKILGLVILVFMLSSSGAIISGILSNKRLERDISKNVTDSFDNVFNDVKNLFKNFQNIAEESVKKTSGLVALSEIKEIAQKSQGRFQGYTQEMISKTGKDVSVSLKELEVSMEEGFNASLAVASDAVGQTIEEATKSQEVLTQLAYFRVEGLIQASLDGFGKIEEVLTMLGLKLEEMTGGLNDQVDSNTIQMMTILGEAAATAPGFSADKAMEKIMPLQESLKNNILKGYGQAYSATKKDIVRVINVIKEQMRLMDLKIKADADKEKIMSSQILQALFEESITKVINIQSEAREKIATVEQTLSGKIDRLNTEVPKELAAFGEEMRKEIDTKTAETVKGAAAVIEESRDALNKSQESAAKRIEEIKISSVEQVKKGIIDVGKSSLIYLFGSMIVIAVVFIIVSLLIVRTITKPSTLMLAMLKALAKGKGDLTNRITIKSSDEIGDLANWFNVFVEQMRNMISQILVNTEQVSNAAQQFSANAEETNASMVQISNGIQDISKGASVQLDKVREVEKIFDELAGKLKLVATNAEIAKDSSVKSAEHAAQGKESTMQLIDKINKIVDAANLSSTAIQELKDSSKEIGDIIVTITSFADQTNLLSLNAAIEAARAGDAGRGFAVVAEEVRKLAEGSAHAANRIAQLVQKIINEIDRAVGLVVSEKEQAEDGRKIVQITSKVQESILTVANKAKDLMITISESVPQQIRATEKVMDVVKQVAQVAEQNAASTQQFSASTEEMTASMEEMSAGAAELAKTSSELRELVGQFKVK